MTRLTSTPSRGHATRVPLALAGALAAALAGCGHDHDVRDHGPVGPGPYAKVLELESVAADRILEEARRYLAARDSAKGGLPSTAEIELYEEALAALFDAAEALEVASRTLRIVEEFDVDKGRGARASGTADVVRAASDRVARDAEELLRSRTAGAAAALKEDRKVLRAALRALKVDVIALETHP